MSTGIGAPNSALVTELNSITLKRSPGDRRSSAICSASFACLIDVPSIEPDVSMMKTASRGLRGAPWPATGAGGTIIASAYVLPSLCSAKIAAPGAARDVGRPHELEVAVCRHGAVGEADRVAVIGRFADVDPVIGTVDLRQREAGMELDVERHRIDESPGRMRNRGRDALGVRHLIRVRSPPRARVAFDCEGARNVAGCDHHREAQPESAGVVAQGLLVFDRDGDFLAGADVRDVRREDVRAFLLDQRRLASFGLGLLVRGARLAALFDLALDPPLADSHLEVIDRRLFGQRERRRRLPATRSSDWRTAASPSCARSFRSPRCRRR